MVVVVVATHLTACHWRRAYFIETARFSADTRRKLVSSRRRPDNANHAKAAAPLSIGKMTLIMAGSKAFAQFQATSKVLAMMKKTPSTSPDPPFLNFDGHITHLNRSTTPLL